MLTTLKKIYLIMTAYIDLLAIKLEISPKVLFCSCIEHLDLNLGCIREPSAEKDFTYLHPVSILKFKIKNTVSVFCSW